MTNKCVQFFLENYKGMKETIPFDDTVDMFDKFKDKCVFSIEDKEIVFLAVYLKLNDSHFCYIKEHPKKLCDPNFILKCLKDEGKNIHFFMAVGKGNSILKCLKQVIEKENPETVSWYKPDMDKIHIIKLRRLLCHQQ